MPKITLALKNRPTIVPEIVSSLSSGGQFLSSLTNKGGVESIGDNTNGQLGITTIAFYNSPVSLGGSKKTFCSVSSSFDFNISIDKNGRLWGWGVNTYGQLGDNSTTIRRTPVSILGDVKTFCKVTTGSNHSLGIDKNGRLWGWGYNIYGQLGDNSTTSRLTPVSVLGAVKTFCKISAYLHSLAIDKNGRAWGWGYNFYGQLGDNSISNRQTPVSVLGTVKTFCQISAGNNHSLSIDKNGRLWSWGFNNTGQLGDNTIVSKRTPVSVLGAVKTFCKISAGSSNSYGIDKNGRLWAWGSNSHGELGRNNTLQANTPVSVLGATKTFCDISANNFFSFRYAIGITNNGGVWGWGSHAGGNFFGLPLTNTPLSVLGLNKTFCDISTGRDHSTVIDKNGRIWNWGINISGQLGDNTSTDRGTPISVLGAVKTFCQISTGQGYTLAIDKNGRVWAWGVNTNGGLGNNSTTLTRTPVSILGAVKTFCQINAYTHSLAIDKNGRAWAWGINTNGRLGDNSLTSRRTPVSVLGAVKTFCQISAGFAHSMAIDKNGIVWGWGSNGNGRLGDNSTVSRRTPISVLGAVKTFCKISAGLDHSMAIDKNGIVWGWGENSSGQLGDNSISAKRTPVSVLGATKTFCHIGGGSGFSTAIDKYGKIWSWGSNSYGVLGDDSFTNKSTPVAVSGTLKTFCKIFAGTNHVLAIDNRGKSWGWGYVNNFVLGINRNIVMTPTSISYL
jgi:alpha-tubulin suppressor-like RCC1 family protein